MTDDPYQKVYRRGRPWRGGIDALVRAPSFSWFKARPKKEVHRPHCLKPDDCQAQTHAHCRSCAAKECNGRPEQRESRKRAVRQWYWGRDPLAPQQGVLGQYVSYDREQAVKNKRRQPRLANLEKAKEYWASEENRKRRNKIYKSILRQDLSHLSTEDREKYETLRYAGVCHRDAIREVTEENMKDIPMSRVESLTAEGRAEYDKAIAEGFLPLDALDIALDAESDGSVKEVERGPINDLNRDNWKR